jgi:hypothetical protein
MICIWDSVQTARKHHQCSECSQPIKPGERYVRQRNVYGNDFYTYKAHDECYDFAIQILCEDDGFVLVDNVDFALECDPPPAVRARLEANG